MASETRFDKIQRAMFSPEDDPGLKLSEKDLQIKQRYEKVFTYWISNPHYSDSQIVGFMEHTCGVSRSVAYKDIQLIKRVLGNVTMASKEWYRHMVVDMCMQAYRMARARKDAKGMAIAADKIGKYTKLDKEDAESMPWDRVIPPNFEPVPDVSILGLEPQNNMEKRRRELRRKYLLKYDPNHFQEADIIDE